MNTPATVESSRAATEKLLAEHPDHIPVIVRHKNYPDEVMRFLVPRECTCGTVLKNIRTRLKLSSTESIFLFVGQFMLPVHQSLDEIYARHHNTADLRLYMHYARENVFG